MKASFVPAALLVAVAPIVAAAQPSNPRADTAASRAAPAVEREMGLRPALAAHGLTVSPGLTNDVSSIAAGGVRSGSAARALFTGIFEADLGALTGWKGASLLVGYAAQRGDNGSELAGDVQAFSNIDATRFAHLYEAWFQQSFGEFARVKIGRVDANTEFAVVDGAANFINAPAGFSPTITGLPTYPDPVPSVNLFLRPVSWLELAAGYFKGTFDDIASIDGVVKDRFMIAQRR
ncbi:MAG: carbohydrate porin [Cytophagaceae bacterium]|nr:carbohydrate porin [Gemmatimonadaceae bacterium]